MQRGCRNTGTKAVKSAPCSLAAAATALFGAEAAGCSAATIERENPSAPVRNPINSAIRTSLCERIIRPPSDELAAGGSAFQLQRTRHLRSPALHREHLALRYLRIFRCSPQYGFRSAEIH